MPLVRGHHSFDDHFTQIPNAWVRDPKLSFKARGLLACIMSHQSGWQMSVNSLSAFYKEGKDSIRSAIRELEEHGYLKRTQENNGRFGEAVWTTCDPLAENPMAENPTTENPTPKKTITKEEQLERTVNPQAQALEDASFDEFWKIYPLRRDKAAAKRAFRRALKKTDLASLLEGARRYADDPNRASSFTKYPATWLNAEAWLDGPLPEREKTKEERQAEALEKYHRDRQAALEASRRLREEMEEAKRRAEENPPEWCEHDRIKLVCKKCQTQQVA